VSTSINERALSLLGMGIQQEKVASALGVTPSYISQLIADEDFARQVTELKFQQLSKHTTRDMNYDTIEDKLQEKLLKSLPLLIRPQDILGAIKIVNGASRRGVDTTDDLVTKANIVQLNMPVQIVQEFTTNINNQVIKAGDQSLITMQSSDLRKKVEDTTAPKTIEHSPTAPIEEEENNKKESTIESLNI